MEAGEKTHRTIQSIAADYGFMFAFFSNRLGCIGSIIVSVVGTIVLLLVLRGCGGAL